MSDQYVSLPEGLQSQEHVGYFRRQVVALGVLDRAVKVLSPSAETESFAQGGTERASPEPLKKTS